MARFRYDHHLLKRECEYRPPQGSYADLEQKAAEIKAKTKPSQLVSSVVCSCGQRGPPHSR